MAKGEGGPYPDGGERGADVLHQEPVQDTASIFERMLLNICRRMTAMVKQGIDRDDRYSLGQLSSTLGIVLGMTNELRYNDLISEFFNSFVATDADAMWEMLHALDAQIALDRRFRSEMEAQRIAGARASKQRLEELTKGMPEPSGPPGPAIRTFDQSGVPRRPGRMEGGTRRVTGVAIIGDRVRIPGRAPTTPTSRSKLEDTDDGERREDFFGRTERSDG